MKQNRITIGALLRAGVLAVLACAIACVFFSCGHSKPAMTTMTTAGAKQSPTVSAEKTLSLADVLRQIDSVPLPKNADPALFEKLRARLKELVMARSKDGKTVSAFGGGNLNTVGDLTAVSDAQNQNATVTWTEKLKGDYNNDGTVDLASTKFPRLTHNLLTTLDRQGIMNLVPILVERRLNRGQ